MADATDRIAQASQIVQAGIGKGDRIPGIHC
jgi:hypothetical protein